MSGMELVACLTYALSVWLAARNNVNTWWIGIVGCLLYGWVFFVARLYADVTLQVFFILTSGIGWVHWLKGNQGCKKVITRTTRRSLVIMLVGAFIVAVIYAAILHFYTNAWSPWLDSLILTFSVLAQLMLMRRKLESWPMWLIVNTIAVPVYAARELWLTAGLYLIFWVNAWYGFYQWRREWATQ
ncbi:MULTISPECIES: nicotinamide riboside transporter PnuC [Enterobacterales]|uniref:nicotinamide riboside transporter PnuC n=1 Tax=Enterobacterales TaxID=91347 RepID=UPI002EDB7581